MYWDDEMDDDRIEKIKHTLVVGRSSSHCGNCGREAFMGKSHDILAGYAHNGELGCKIEFKYVASGYVGLFDDAKISLEKMTGLEYWDMYGLQTEPEKKAI